MNGITLQAGMLGGYTNESSGNPLVHSVLVWLDASDISNLLDNSVAGVPISSGDPFKQWSDISGNNHHAIQTNGEDPNHAAAVQNGLGVARFNGTADWLYFASNPISTGSGTTIMVVKAVNDPGEASPDGLRTSSPLGKWGSDATNPGNHYPWIDGVIYEGWGSTTRKTVGDPTPALDVFHIVTIISAPGDWRLYIGNDLIYSTATNTTGWSSGQMEIARTNVFPDIYFFEGDIGEIQVYNAALSNTTRLALVSAAATKWGITL